MLLLLLAINTWYSVLLPYYMLQSKMLLLMFNFV